MLSKRETLNRFGVYMVSKTRIIIPVREEYIGIICGKNRSNLKKIYEKFDISIFFQKNL
jgi:predicted PilT family ATPase